MREPANKLKSRPTSGCYISGLYLEGARWGYSIHELAESKPKELYTDMPVIWLKPSQNRVKPTDGIYECPVYKTLTRAGEPFSGVFTLPIICSPGYQVTDVGSARR